MEAVRCETNCGSLEGFRKDGVCRYLGIRYAAAGRWEYPREIRHWDGVCRAAEFGPAAMQQRTFEPETEESFYYREFRKGIDFSYSEDCQYLNLYVPKHCENAPVILYIHGGAFQGGAGHEKPFDGSLYAQRGIIFASCNYRLGPFGFCSHPLLKEEAGHTGNYGLYDQLTAVKWLYHNIGAFGGNPENITVMGQSAGAMSIQQLCSSREAEPYIAKAIMTSGGGIGKQFAKFMTAEETYPFWEKVLSALGSSMREWREASPEQVLKQTNLAMAGDMEAINNVMPVLDGVMITERGEELEQSGNWLKIPYMAGTTKDDMLAPVLTGMAKEWAALQFEKGYPSAYCFWFGRNLPGDDKGAWHSSELWYTIGQLGRCWRPFEKWDREISRTMMQYIENFVRNGTPSGKGLPVWESTNHPDAPVLCITDSEIKMGMPFA